MEPIEKIQQTHVVVESPSERREVVTERTESAPRESGISAGMVAIIAIVALFAVGAIVYLVSSRNANESANRNANLDLARYKKLWSQDSVSKQIYDTQASVVQQDEGMVKLDQGLIQSTKVNLIYTRITSPVDGRVGF